MLENAPLRCMWMQVPLGSSNMFAMLKKSMICSLPTDRIDKRFSTSGGALERNHINRNYGLDTTVWTQLEAVSTSTLHERVLHNKGSCRCPHHCVQIWLPSRRDEFTSPRFLQKHLCQNNFVKKLRSMKQNVENSSLYARTKPYFAIKKFYSLHFQQSSLLWLSCRFRKSEEKIMINATDTGMWMCTKRGQMVFAISQQCDPYFYPCEIPVHLCLCWLLADRKNNCRPHDDCSRLPMAVDWTYDKSVKILSFPNMCVPFGKWPNADHREITDMMK